jgi:endonuclease/exonuclease/phosphatase family metal-dependent hydrolase
VLEIDIAAEKYLIINLYHSPNKNDAEFLKFLDDYLDEIADFTGTIVFMGDFNLNLFHSTYYVNGYRNIIYKYGLYQIIQQTTRVTYDSATLIDHVLTNVKNIRYEIHNTPRISDHSIVKIKINESRKCTDM